MTLLTVLLWLFLISLPILKRVRAQSLTCPNAKICGAEKGAIEMKHSKIKALGVFLGNGSMNVSNCTLELRLWIEKRLNPWRSRRRAIVWWQGLCFKCYSLVFKFFWCGKRDLIARNDVIHLRRKTEVLL